MAETSQMVRSYLKNLGYKDEDITYQAGASGQPGTVNLQGKFFTQGTPKGGHITLGQSQLDSAFNQFKGTQATNQTNELLDKYKANITQPIQPFTYDVNQIKNDPTFQSQLNSFTQDTNRGTNQALVNLGRRGIGNSQSGVVAETAGQQNINNFANNELLPRMIAEAYSKYVDQNNQQNTQNQNILGLAEVFNNRNKDLNAEEQQDWMNRFNFGQAIGTFGNGQKTLQNQEFQYTQGRDKVADQQWEDEFERIKKQDGINNALNWAQNSISQQNADTAATNASNSATNSTIDNLMNVFKATGIAPAGLESLGIQAGDKLPIDTGSTTTPKVDAKESVTVYNGLYDDVNDFDAVEKKAKELGQTPKQVARQLLEGNKPFLTDTDYKKINGFINDNY